jgi:putative membrane fusion protein
MKGDTEEKSQKMIELTIERRKRTASADKTDTENKNAGESDEAEMPDPKAPASDKKKKTVRRITLGGLLLAVFMVFYIPSLFNWLSGSNAAQDVIRNGVIEEYVSADAVIIRQEKVLEPASIDGRYIPEINEGEKAAAFSQIAMVTGSESDELLRKIEDINDKIVKARMEQVEKSDFFSADLAKLDEEIGNKVQDLIIACNEKNFGKMGKQRSEIRKIVEKKAEIAAGSSTDGYINSLQQQKKSIQKSINENTRKVVTSMSGIVSYSIDGYESVLEPGKIEELSSDELKQIIESNPDGNAESGKVQQGQPFVKIIRGNDIYLAAVIPSDRAEPFEEGNSIKLRVNDPYLEASGVISHISKEDDGSLVVTVKVSRGVDFLSDRRVVNVDFITKTEEGLKVPKKCLRDITPDGKRARIMLVVYNVASNRYVDILCSDDEYAIIKTPEGEYEKTVNLYNIYLINPDNIEEGDIVRK